jgi:steroid delta-isomerase-like uncharacterized protein
MKSFMRGRLFFSASVLMMVIVFFVGCQQQPPNPSQTLKPIIDRGIAIWNDGNLDEVGSVWDQNVVRTVNQLPEVRGLDEMKKVISGFRTAYPDLKLTSDEEIYAENKATLRWSLTGTNAGPGQMPPTGKAVKLWGITILHFAEGKVTEEIVSYDDQSLMEQLGYTMMPPKGGKK